MKREQQYILYAVIGVVVVYFIYQVMGKKSPPPSAQEKPKYGNCGQTKVVPLMPQGGTVSGHIGTPDKSNSCGGSCPAFGKSATSCSGSNITSVLLNLPFTGGNSGSNVSGDSHTRTHLSVPSGCVDKSSRNSPSVASVEASPWVMEMIKGSPPIPNCNQEDPYRSLKNVFNSCSKMKLDSTSPIGFGADYCSKCTTGGNPEKCLTFAGNNSSQQQQGLYKQGCPGCN